MCIQTEFNRNAREGEYVTAQANFKDGTWGFYWLIKDEVPKKVLTDVAVWRVKKLKTPCQEKPQN
jgi:hypothetical protein